MNLFVVLVLLAALLPEPTMSFLSARGGMVDRDRMGKVLKRHALQSDVLDLLPTSMSMAELESYESSGVPLWAVFGSIFAVGITLSIPVVFRKMQVKKNSRSLPPDFDQKL